MKKDRIKNLVFFLVICLAVYTFFFSPAAQKRKFRYKGVPLEFALKDALMKDKRYQMVNVRFRGTAWKSPTRISGEVNSQNDLDALKLIVKDTLKELNYKLTVTISNESKMTFQEFMKSIELYEINYWLSKSGEFIEGKDLLKSFSKSFSDEQILQVHEYFKEESMRFETEWRDEFISLFPQIKDKLPEIPEWEFYESQMHEFIDNKDHKALKALIIKMDIDSWKHDNDNDIFAFESEDENGDLPLEKAKRNNDQVSIKLLEDAIKTIKANAKN